MTQLQAMSMAILEEMGKAFVLAFQRVVMSDDVDSETMDWTSTEMIDLGQAYASLHKFIDSREARRAVSEVPPSWPMEAICDFCPEPPASDEGASR